MATRLGVVVVLVVIVVLAVFVIVVQVGGHAAHAVYTRVGGTKLRLAKFSPTTLEVPSRSPRTD